MPEKKKRSEWGFDDWLKYDTSATHYFRAHPCPSGVEWECGLAACDAHYSGDLDEACRKSVEEYAEMGDLPWLPDPEPPKTIDECVQRLADAGFDTCVEISNCGAGVRVFHDRSSHIQCLLEALQHAVEKYC